MNASLKTSHTYSSSDQLGIRTRLSGEKPAARSALMKWVLVGYFVLLGLSIVVPFVAATWLSGDELGGFSEVMQQTSGLGQGLFGILGVVVGYYFREGTSPEGQF